MNLLRFFSVVLVLGFCQVAAVAGSTPVNKKTKHSTGVILTFTAPDTPDMPSDDPDGPDGLTFTAPDTPDMPSDDPDGPDGLTYTAPDTPDMPSDDPTEPDTSSQGAFLSPKAFSVSSVWESALGWFKSLLIIE